MDSAQFEIDIRVVLLKKDDDSHSAALGKGVVELCERVDRLGSLNKAAASMGMAYSKAWRILKHAEEGFGFALLERRGPHGSSLTEDGKEIIKAYHAIDERLREDAQVILDDVMG